MLKGNEMKEFRENVENFVEECQLRIEELRDQFSEVKRLCCNHYNNNNNMNALFLSLLSIYHQLL